MSMKHVMVLVAAALASGCTCIQEQQPVAAIRTEAPAGPAAVAATPNIMAREAEQVIAIAETPPPVEKEIPPAAPLVELSPAGFSRCSLNGDMRTIVTEQGKDGSCQVVYDSAGQNHVVASKSKDLAVCTRLHERLRKNLVASGFKCE